MAILDSSPVSVRQHTKRRVRRRNGDLDVHFFNSPANRRQSRATGKRRTWTPGSAIYLDGIDGAGARSHSLKAMPPKPHPRAICEGMSWPKLKNAPTHSTAEAIALSCWRSTRIVRS